MRQRKPKDLEKRINECGEFLIREPGPEIWRRSFGRSEEKAAREPELFVEIGCGKGDFIIAKAMDDPANNYLGIEGQESVILRGLEKAMWLSGKTAEPAAGQPAEPAAGRLLENLRFTGVYVKSMQDLFEDGTLAGIYLNFSDPWPKARHYKRRLTWRKRLKEYEAALKKGGAIEIKTDNDALFDFTLEEIKACGWEPVELTRDLHSSDLEARLTMTEYETRFHKAGKKINYVKIIV